MTTRETGIGRVGADDGHVAWIELIPQEGGSLWMQLNGDHPCTGGDERVGYRSSSRTDIENKVTGNHAGVDDEAARPTTIELMPPPPWPAEGGHGGPSPCSKTWLRW
jgi:hypothetical protein